MGSLGLFPQLMHWSSDKRITSVLISNYYVSEKVYLVLGGLCEMIVVCIAGINAKYDRFEVYPELSRKQTMLDKIPRTVLHSGFLKKIRRFISTIVFGIVVIGIIIVSFLLGTVPKDFLSGSSDLFNSQVILLAAFVAMIQTQSSSICFLLTSYEEHSTWSSFRRQYFIKTLLLKVVSTAAGFIGITFISITESNSVQCTIPNYALILIVFSYAIKYVVLFVSLIGNRMHFIPKPDFNLADEFADTIHKTFIGFSTFFGFPIIGLFSAVISVLHYGLLLFSLKYIYNPPIRPSKSLMPVVNYMFSNICFLSLISSRMAFIPGILEVSLTNACLSN